MLDSRPAKSASPRGRPPGRGAGSGNGVPPHSGGPGRRRPRVKRLRLALILAGLAVIAAVSAVFGMLTAVTSELPDLENQAQFRAARNSVLLSDGKKGRQFAKLTGSQNRILVGQGEIAANVENAVVAVEDRRFYQHEGVDYRGVVRALVQDVRRQRVVQGGSTITQQFVKNALEAQGNRSVFQKVREAALAYRLEREWSKKKVLTQYLNSVYFGNGAYGVESAMRTYFGKGADRFDPKRRAAREAEPHEAALLAAVIASPSAYDPLQNPEAARERRDLVLRRMLEERTISPRQFARAERQALPAAEDVSPPKPDTDVPYFSTWVQEQLVDRYGAERVFGGGLRVTTTLDLELQKRAQTAVDRLSGSGPSAALVAIENRTGKVKALVGGDDFGKRPFNVATNGKRQPGSALKPFTLLAALEQGVSPDRTFASQPKTLKGNFKVANYEDDYAGVTTLRDATARSDNSVFAELGVDVVGTKKIARLARRTGIETPLSTNPAMTLGGLETGVTPLEMAYAYSTIANKGRRTSGTLASSSMGPVALERVRTEDDDLEVNRRRTRRAFSQATGDQTRQILRGVVDGGTGTAARVDGFAAGKTGTTENYGDAWFVGFDDDLTVAVWVGYPEKVREMKTEFRGAPVAGGTWPAEIWRTFMLSAHELRRQRNPNEPEPKIPEAGSGGGGGGTGVPYQAPGTGQSPGYAPSTPYAPSSPGPSYSAPSPSYSPQGPSSSGPQGPSPSPRTAPSTPSTPAPSTPSPGGTGGGGGTGGSGGGGGGSGGGGTGGGGTGGGGTTVP